MPKIGKRPQSDVPVPEPSSAQSFLISGLTVQTHEALGKQALTVVKFPFLIGRAGRQNGHAPCDLYLSDLEPYQLSRNHCAILWIPSLEGFFVQDSGSRLGTIVNGSRIGRGHTKSMAALKKGANEIALGNDASPFRFEVRVPKNLP